MSKHNYVAGHPEQVGAILDTLDHLDYPFVALCETYSPREGRMVNVYYVGPPMTNQELLDAFLASTQP